MNENQKNLFEKFKGAFIEIKLQGNQFYHGVLTETTTDMVVLNDILNGEMLINKTAIIYVRKVEKNNLPIFVKLKKFDKKADEKLLK